ncbi:hypothetical protein FIBSPDRAFT_331513 [Athelia psychrophila]|uniref:Uncharacterized protein n=1 Tax=Athelia psychrophila TaxID=1759441 RepID=A0A167WGH1_9AGAM|nr:hypothetical protein FIBSPDRAFT_331513 [Fibularhizoctonia sp. CBS 109695]
MRLKHVCFNLARRIMFATFELSHPAAMTLPPITAQSSSRLCRFGHMFRVEKPSVLAPTLPCYGYLPRMSLYPSNTRHIASHRINVKLIRLRRRRPHLRGLLRATTTCALNHLANN